MIYGDYLKCIAESAEYKEYVSGRNGKARFYAYKVESHHSHGDRYNDRLCRLSFKEYAYYRHQYYVQRSYKTCLARIARLHIGIEKDTELLQVRGSRKKYTADDTACNERFFIGLFSDAGNRNSAGADAGIGPEKEDES